MVNWFFKLIICYWDDCGSNNYVMKKWGLHIEWLIGFVFFERTIVVARWRGMVWTIRGSYACLVWSVPLYSKEVVFIGIKSRKWILILLWYDWTMILVDVNTNGMSSWRTFIQDNLFTSWTIWLLFQKDGKEKYK